MCLVFLNLQTCLPNFRFFRCLRIIKRVQTLRPTNAGSESTTENASAPAGASDNSSEGIASDLYSETIYSTIHSLISRYTGREEDLPSQPSGSRDRTENTNDLSSNNDNRYKYFCTTTITVLYYGHKYRLINASRQLRYIYHALSDCPIMSVNHWACLS